MTLEPDTGQILWRGFCAVTGALLLIAFSLIVWYEYELIKDEIDHHG